MVCKESVGMKLAAIYEHQPKIRSSRLLRSAKPDRFLGLYFVSGLIPETVIAAYL